MATDLQTRIDAMFRRDKLWALGFVVVLWSTLAFVFFSVNSLIPDDTMRVVIAVSAVILGLFNRTSFTNSISAIWTKPRRVTDSARRIGTSCGFTSTGLAE